MAEIQVGDQLYFVPYNLVRPGKPQWLTVKRVGRKWIELPGSMRADKVSLRIDGGNYTSPGNCYRTKEEYDQEVERQKLWTKIRDFIYATRIAPEDADLKIIAKALNINTP